MPSGKSGAGRRRDMQHRRLHDAVFHRSIRVEMRTCASPTWLLESRANLKRCQSRELLASSSPRAALWATCAHRFGRVWQRFGRCRPSRPALGSRRPSFGHSWLKRKHFRAKFRNCSGQVGQSRATFAPTSALLRVRFIRGSRRSRTSNFQNSWTSNCPRTLRGPCCLRRCQPLQHNLHHKPQFNPLPSPRENTTMSTKPGIWTQRPWIR